MGALDLGPLTAMSARVGADPLLVQGPGGNASLKRGDELWVKASGAWLAEAEARPIFAGLSLSGVLARVAAGEENLSPARLPEAPLALRPSIETALHALMPQPVVVHAHAVNAMTLSVLADGEARARAALDGFVDFAWVGYRRPGAPLAAAVTEALARARADVLMLQNHGVVVGAETPEAAEALLQAVEDRLALPVRPLPSPEPAALATAGAARYEPLPAFSGLALDAELTAALAAAPLVPDQVVFLGGAVPALQPRESLEDAARRVRAATGVEPAFILAPGLGAFGLKSRTPAAQSVIQGLHDLAVRLPAGAAVRGLPEGAAEELLAWEAEAYRIRLQAEGRR